MYDEQDVYVAFRKAQANFHSRPYRLPKDWDSHFKNRMSKKNQDALTLAAKFFSTKWRNIDMGRFFEAGFDLYKKSFSYVRFFDPKVMSLYIERDKIHKRELDLHKTSFVKSAKFVKEKYGKGRLREYARKRVGEESVPIRDYVRGYIDQFFLAWLIREKYLILEDVDRSNIPYIVEKYRDYLAELDEMKGFVEKVKEKLL